MLTREWVVVESDGEEKFYKDHETILINLFNNQYMSGGMKKNLYRFVELGDTEYHLIDLENKVDINLSTYIFDEKNSVKRIKLLPP